MAYPYKLHIIVNKSEKGIIESSTNTNNRPNLYNIIADSDYAGWLDYDFYYVKYYTYTTKQFFYSSDGYKLDSDTTWWMNASGTTELDIVFCNHTITFDFNGGSGGLDSVPAVCGEYLPDLDESDLPTRDGYAFDGYWTSKTTTNTKFKYYNADGTSNYIWGSGEGAADTQHSYGSYTLYAHWKQTSYTLTLDNDGADYAGTRSVKVTIGEIVPDITPPRKTGYKFLGYWVDGTSIQYYDKNGKGLIVWNATNNGTLTARWEAITYDIPIYYGGGTYYDSITATYNNKIPNITPPTATGYNFLGTYDIDGNRYHNSSGICSIIWDGDDSLELYLRFEGKYKLTITYDALGGKFSDNTTKFTETYNGPEQYVSFTVTNEEPTKSGATFNYWAGLNTDGTIYTDSDGNKKYYYSGKTYELNSNYTHTLSAIWTYTISLKDYDDQTTYSTIKVTYGEQLPESVPIPIKEGYEFLGYYTEGYFTGSGGVQYYYADGTRKLNSDWVQNYGGTIYAAWKAAPYKAILNFKYSPTSTNIVESITSWSNTTVTTVTIPEITMSRSDCTFVCWAALKSDGTFYNNMRYAAGDPIDLTASENGVIHTLTAIWKYKLWLDPNDENTYNLNDLPYVWVVYYDYPPNLNKNNLPERADYRFKGYFSARNSSDEQWYDSLGNGMKVWDRDYAAQIFAQWGPPLFEWTYEKRTGMEWNLTVAEWTGLQDFINSKRSTPYAFKYLASYDTDFTANHYNEVVDAIGKGTKVVKGQPITEKLMYEIVDNANAM